MRATIIWTVAACALALAACGGGTSDANGSTTPPPAAAVTTEPTIETTEATTTTVETWEMSRDARLAVLACADEIGFSPGFFRAELVDYNDAVLTQEVLDVCQEAALQLEAENAPLGPNPIRQLAVEIAEINLALQMGITAMTLGAPESITVQNFDEPLFESAREAVRILGEIK